MKLGIYGVSGYPEAVRGHDPALVQLDGYALDKAYVVQRSASGPTRFDVCVTVPDTCPARSLVIADCRRPEYAVLIVDALKAKYGKGVGND